MKKIFHLSTCSTCQKIIKELDLRNNDFEFQDIKETNIDEKTLDMIAKDQGSYEAIFSKRAMKFRSLGLNVNELKEADYRKLMLEEYTFLKRPFIITEGQIFIGNSKKTISSAAKAINK